MSGVRYHVATPDNVHTCGHQHTTLSGVARCVRALEDDRCAGCGRKRCRRRSCSGVRVSSGRWYGHRIVVTDYEHGGVRRLTDDERADYDAARERRPRW